ncbi:hypothetical protein NPIL_201231 [Nephila pilipes]|uniref:Uncharacterized protein n=1 Tax=Nephila pilipes TaxID=299642 RepID=A0A8X6TI58_NEPPI|nr:hypothetical protein NPIL_201231 [Nephila pilipes]
MPWPILHETGHGANKVSVKVDDEPLTAWTKVCSSLWGPAFVNSAAAAQLASTVKTLSLPSSVFFSLPPAVVGKNQEGRGRGGEQTVQ